MARSEIDERKIRGIILRSFLWCDAWHAELYQLKQKFNLPVLDIEVSGEDKQSPAQTIGRINAFLEMLRERKPKKISLAEWDKLFDRINKKDLPKCRYLDPLSRHFQDGDLRLEKLKFDIR